MAGLAIGLVRDRAALVALLAGGSVAVAASLLVDPSAAVMIGGLLGPLAGLLFAKRHVEAA
jgi:predicted branched-subunit amino acid permease